MLRGIPSNVATIRPTKNCQRKRAIIHLLPQRIAFVHISKSFDPIFVLRTSLSSPYFSSRSRLSFTAPRPSLALASHVPRHNLLSLALGFDFHLSHSLTPSRTISRASSSPNFRSHPSFRMLSEYIPNNKWVFFICSSKLFIM